MSRAEYLAAKLSTMPATEIWDRLEISLELYMLKLTLKAMG